MKVEIKKIDVGTVAALGVAVGGITTAFGIILDSFLRVRRRAGGPAAGSQMLASSASSSPRS